MYRKNDCMKIFKDIIKQIKKYKNIVIARHIGADPDALGSQFALKEIIKENFKDKNVYAVGSIASRFRFMGILDKPENLDFSNSLLIVLDTPDVKRIEDVESVNDFGFVIKIDHHPFVEKYGEIEYIEECSSTCQIIFKFVLDTKLKLPTKAAENLYIGIVGDTDRFLHDYTSVKTFELVTRLLKDTNVDFTSLYKNLYHRPLAEVKFEGYIYSNITITENGVAYIKLTDKLMKEYGVDSAAAGNMINDLKFVDEITIWIFLSEDVKSNLIRANIRSVGPYINETASKFGGGGHIYASGARLKSWEEADDLIKAYDELMKDYKKLN